MDDIQQHIEAELLPEDQRFSIIKLDTMKPPTDPECAMKLFETDTLDDVTYSDTDFSLFLAYDADGNSYDISPDGEA